MMKDFVKITVDLVCVVIFATPLFVYNVLDAVPLSQIGFFCSDTSIRYPYHDSTVSSLVMIIVGICIILISSTVVEFYLYLKNERMCTDGPLHPVLMAVYRAFGYFLIGAAMNVFLTDVAKLSVGRLRPHFLDVCKPNVNCSTADPYKYFNEYECTATSHDLIPRDEFPKRLRDARKSFPSGHASFSAFFSLFVIIYLEFRLRSKNTRIVRHLVQLGVMGWGVWVTCTRVSDYKHRLSDIGGGFVLGAVVGLFSGYLFIRSSQSMLRREATQNHGQGLPVMEVNCNNETPFPDTSLARPPSDPTQRTSASDRDRTQLTSASEYKSYVDDPV